MANAQDKTEGLPCYIALTALSSFAANKFHLVLYNAASITIGQAFVIKVRLVAMLPGTSTVTGAAPSMWSLSRRGNPTTAPAGGVISISTLDSAFAIPASITAHSAPTTAPAGGTVTIINQFIPQADEQKVTTADAPTLAALFSNWGGQVVYRSADVYPARPLVLRAGETLEVQQSATAGTGNCRVLCIFTIG
jgi:hypothetical protein